MANRMRRVPGDWVSLPPMHARAFTLTALVCALALVWKGRARADDPVRRPVPAPDRRAPRALSPGAHPPWPRGDDDDRNRGAHDLRAQLARDTRAARGRGSRSARVAGTLPARRTRRRTAGRLAEPGPAGAGRWERRALRADGLGHADGARVRWGRRVPPPRHDLLERKHGKQRGDRRHLAPALGLRLLPHRGPHLAPVRGHADALRALRRPVPAVVRLLRRRERHREQRERARRRSGRDHRSTSAGSRPRSSASGSRRRSTTWSMPTSPTASARRWSSRRTCGSSCRGSSRRSARS